MRIFMAMLLVLFFSCSFASESLQPMPANEAFVFSANYDKTNQIVLQWKIAPNYYLYRDRLVISPGLSNKATLGNIVLPKGVLKKDSTRGSYQVYSGLIQVVAPFTSQKQDVIDLTIRYQGCSVKGFCYSPITKSLVVTLSDLEPPKDLTPYISGMPSVRAHVPTEQENVQHILMGKNIFIVILSFLGLGLLLAFTPCVLPMIPILSGIIMGHRKKKLTTGKTFSLSLAYVVGMAITYAIAGLVVALIGSHVQTQFQRPWVIVFFSGIFVLLALSLFDLYQLRLPGRLQQRLTQWSNHQKSGTYWGVFFMGSISSLIVSPCITPPLVGVLAYIAQTGNGLLGAAALFTLGIGMGIPLLLIGVSAGKILPKAGPWMVTLERVMGWMMLAFAIWMISRVIPGSITLFLWSLWLLGFSIFAGAFAKTRGDKFLLRKSIAIVLFVYALILMIGAILGNSDPFNPWQNVTLKKYNQTDVHFVTLNNAKQLDDFLIIAKQEKRPVIIDFYADWCESCIRMERYVLNRPDVQHALANFMLLRADITRNTSFDQTLMKRFHVIAPPTFIFMDAEGDTEQLIGEVDATTLLAYLLRIETKGVDRAK